MTAHKHNINQNGFTVIPGIYTSEEVRTIISAIEQADQSSANFLKTEGLFAIRQFLKEITGVIPALFTAGFTELAHELFGLDYFIIKSIYFDKPEGSNWFVSYHQDLTISVDRKVDIPGYGPWTVKQNQFAVQPPQEVMENIYTVRIHLDDTTAQNGALHVIPGSHLNGIVRTEAIDKSKAEENICEVPCGGVMIMKPLLFHSSGRTENGMKRRVIHLEFSNRQLPDGLQWAEKQQVST